LIIIDLQKKRGHMHYFHSDPSTGNSLLELEEVTDGEDDF
jgi:hypothetical protein